ncbi:MAG: hypothetical protein UZ18_ATM001000962 [Armatimonadetes bacterium OLB18]|nr:MAG: hypothetical protein UZ18_ATM001000962 [Armatimonadetes bacterium OLB18]
MKTLPALADERARKSPPLPSRLMVRKELKEHRFRALWVRQNDLDSPVGHPLQSLDVIPQTLAEAARVRLEIRGEIEFEAGRLRSQ